MMIKEFDHNDSDVSDYIETLKELNLNGSYYLMLLVGAYRRGKSRFLDQIVHKLELEIIRIDLREIVDLDEETTFRNIDRVFGSLTEKDKILWLTHGDRLCGAYTGYTQSRVRYATPQERYLIQKLKQIQKVVLLDINEPDNVDKTLQRSAHSLIRFDGPQSLLRRFGWKLKQTSVHGNIITSDRVVTGL